jgi:hypothetical protein
MLAAEAVLQILMEADVEWLIDAPANGLIVLGKH